VRQSSAYNVVVSLEQLTAARLASCRADIARLMRRRYDLINRNARVRQSLLDRQWCSGFEFAALFAHTAWTAAVASSLLAAKSKERVASAKLAQERLHWARCRRGLERRMKHAATH
jgi:hypothetical protein